MLDEHGIPYRYREYRTQPLTGAELRDILARLGLPARALLRKNDKSYKELGLTGTEPDADLIRHMAANPTLVQRPIGIKGDRAALGRPIENLLALR